MEILENFKKSLTWADSLSIKVDVNITPKGIPGKGPYKLNFILYRKYNLLQWEGNIAATDCNGKTDPDNNHLIRKIINEREYFDAIGKPGLSPIGALITTDFNGIKEDLLDSDEFGGPLFAKIYGTNHKNIPDLLSDCNDIHLRQNQEDFNGTSCYILEGTTKYGKVTAWVAPDKGYTALKWRIEKTGDDLVNDVPISRNELILWDAQFECKELQQVGDSIIPKIAIFDINIKEKNGNNRSLHVVYILSDIQLNPDFNALGAFKIDLSEGAKVTVPESPGIKYIWKGGKIEPFVDGPTFEEIDKTIDQIKKQQ